MTKFKKTIATLLSVALFWASVITPAKAFFPLMAGGYLLGSGIADYLIADTTVLAAAAMGTGVLYLNFKDPSQQGNPITVQLNPKAKLPVPSGWSASAAGVVQPVPPGSVAPNFTYTYNGVSGLSQGGYISACTAYYVSSYGAGSSCSSGGSACSSTQINAGGFNLHTATAGGSLSDFCVNPSSSCPAGYTLSGTSPNQVCNVSTASSVIKPTQGVDTFMRTGNTFARDPQQNPSDTNQVNNNSYTYTTNTFNTYNSSTGETTNITLNGDSTTTITQTYPNSDGKTSTQVKTTLGAPDATTGNTPITGKSTQTVQGTGALAGTVTNGASPTIDTSNLATHADVNADTAANTANGTKLDGIKAGQCGGTGEPPCKIDETGTGNATGNYSQSTTDLNAITPHTLGVDGYTGSRGMDYSLPTIGGTNSCTNDFTYQMMGHTVTLDYCTYWMPIKYWIGWFLYFATLVYCYRRVRSTIGVN